MKCTCGKKATLRLTKKEGSYIFVCDTHTQYEHILATPINKIPQGVESGQCKCNALSMAIHKLHNRRDSLTPVVYVGGGSQCVGHHQCCICDDVTNWSFDQFYDLHMRHECSKKSESFFCTRY